MVNDCKGVIPGILLKMGQTAANNQDIDGAIAKLNEAVAKAEEYGNAEIAAKAKDLIPVVMMADGNTLYNAKQYAEAIVEFEKVLQYDPENGMAYLMIGRAKNGLGDEAAAVANLEKAATMGQQANANKLLLGIFANKAAAAYKGKNNAAAYENAKKASEYGDNAQVYMIGGIAAYNLKKYDDAIAMLGKAKPSNSISYYLARAYEDMGNSAKACEYYNKIANDANFGAYAKSKISALCK